MKVAGRRWAAVVLAVGLLAGTVEMAAAQGLWEDPAFALYREAADAMNRGDYARATALADQAIAQYPGHALAYYLRGQAAGAQSRWEEAATAFQKVVELYPGSFAAHRDLGTADEHLARVDDAVRAYEAALALHDDEDLRVHLALLLAGAGQAARARTLLQKLTTGGDARPEVWAALGRIAYDAGDYATAERDMLQATTLRDDGRTWFNVAMVRLRRNDVPGALQALDRAAAHPEMRDQARAEARRIRDAVLLGGSGAAGSPVPSGSGLPASAAPPGATTPR